jgi:hypothetical protein
VLDDDLGGDAGNEQRRAPRTHDFLARGDVRERIGGGAVRLRVRAEGRVDFGNGRPAAVCAVTTTGMSNRCASFARPATARRKVAGSLVVARAMMVG